MQSVLPGLLLSLSLLRLGTAQTATVLDEAGETVVEVVTVNAVGVPTTEILSTIVTPVTITSTDA